MDTDLPPDEFADASIRRFFTHLFITRAKRHLARLALIYNWSETQLEEYTTRFIVDSNFIPLFKKTWS